MNNTKEIDHDGRNMELHRDVGFGVCDFDNPVIANFSNEDFGDIAIDDIGFTGSQSSGVDVANFIESAQGFDIELTDSEASIIRLAERQITSSGRRRAAAKSEKVYITHEDFDEGPERNAFLLIYGYAENLFEEKGVADFDASSGKKANALEFFFCRTLARIHFEDAAACIDGQIRIDVIRLRFMLEFWIRGWKLPQLPDGADGLPSRIELMAAQFGGMIGVSLVKEAWFEPGISTAQLLERVIDDRSDKIADMVTKSFKELVCSYVLSLSKDRVYTTGKNPILELEDKLNDPTVSKRGQLANIYWSRRF